MIATTTGTFLVLAIGCLVLALRSWRSHRMSFESTAWMVVAWILIIAIVGFLAARFTG